MFERKLEVHMEHDPNGGELPVTRSDTPLMQSCDRASSSVKATAFGLPYSDAQDPARSCKIVAERSQCIGSFAPRGRRHHPAPTLQGTPTLQGHQNRRTIGTVPRACRDSRDVDISGTPILQECRRFRDAGTVHAGTPRLRTAAVLGSAKDFQPHSPCKEATWPSYIA
jgi:hypothetical protein